MEEIPWGTIALLIACAVIPTAYIRGVLTGVTRQGDRNESRIDMLASKVDTVTGAHDELSKAVGRYADQSEGRHERVNKAIEKLRHSIPKDANVDAMQANLTALETEVGDIVVDVRDLRRHAGLDTQPQARRGG